MATIYYVDPLAPDAPHDGSDWSHAWTMLQAAIDSGVIAPGDTVLCRGTEMLAATVDGTNLALLSGTKVLGNTKFIGCAPGGTEAEPLARQGQYVLDGSGLGAAADCVIVPPSDSSAVRITMENLTFRNSPEGFGFRIVEGQSTDLWYWNFRRCVFENNRGLFEGSSGGLEAVCLVRTLFYQCRFSGSDLWGCGIDGVGNSNLFLFCEINHNYFEGVYIAGNNNIFIGCLFHGNGWSFDGNSGSGGDERLNCPMELYFGCVFDGNAGGGLAIENSSHFIVVGCRFTNNGAGAVGEHIPPTAYANPGHGINNLFSTPLDTDESVLNDWNYFFNNVTGGDLVYPMWSPGNSVDGAADGYADAATHNFNLAPEAAGRRVGVPLEWLAEAVNRYWLSMGFSSRDLARGSPVK